MAEIPRRRIIPLRIMILVDSLWIGGAQRHVVGLAAALAARGHDVVVACSVGGELRASLERIPVRVVSLGRRHVYHRFSVVLAVKFCLLLRRERCHVIHAHQVASATAGMVAGNFMRIPVVVTEHTMATWRGPFVRWYGRRIYRLATICIAVSAEIRNRLLTMDRLPVRRVVLIPGVLFPPLPLPKQAIASAGPVVGAVARLCEEKGIGVFLEAIAGLVKGYPQVSFVVVGSGPLRERLRAQAKALRLDGRLHFLGARLDGPALVGGFDVLAVPSLTEGAPLVVMEAMAAGVPVVASAVGGIPELLGHGEAGVLVPAGDPRPLAEAISALLDDPVVRHRLGAAGQRRFALISDHEAVVDHVECIYQAVVDGGAPAGCL